MDQSSDYQDKVSTAAALSSTMDDYMNGLILRDHNGENNLNWPKSEEIEDWEEENLPVINTKIEDSILPTSFYTDYSAAREVFCQLWSYLKKNYENV